MDLRSPRLLAGNRPSVSSPSLLDGEFGNSPEAGLTMDDRGVAGVHELVRDTLGKFARR